MSLTSSGIPPQQSKWRNAWWFPAVMLILVQMASGMRELPQATFFLIYLQDQFGLRPITISGIVAGAQVAGMGAALLGGAISARLGSKWVLVCGLALSGLSSLAFQVTPLWLAAFLWVIGGAGIALATIGGSSYLTRISPRGTLGILAAFYALSLTFGGAVGNPLAAVLIERYSFAAFSWAVMALSAGIILMVIFSFTQMMNSATDPASLRSFWTGVLSTARQKNVQRLVGLRSLPTIFYGMITVLIPLLINDLSGSKGMVAAYGSINLIVASAAQLFTGRTADRRGARLPTLVAYTAIVLSGLGLAVSAGRVWGLFLFGVLGIAAAWSLSTLMYVWVSDSIPKDEHPSTFGLLHAVWSLSMITGSVFGGWFVASTPGLPFMIAGLINVGSFFLAISYYNRLFGKVGTNPATNQDGIK